MTGSIVWAHVRCLASRYICVCVYMYIYIYLDTRPFLVTCIDVNAWRDITLGEACQGVNRVWVQAYALL